VLAADLAAFNVEAKRAGVPPVDANPTVESTR
jgi:hypothetical protein